MSKKIQLLIAIAALALAGASSAGASQHSQTLAVSSSAPIAAIAGDIRPASDIVSSDLGTPSLGNGDQHIAKTGLWSSVKNAAKKVGGAVKSAAKKVGGAVATGAKRIGAGYKNVAVKIGKAIAKSPIGTTAKNLVKGVKQIAGAVKKYYGKK